MRGELSSGLSAAAATDSSALIVADAVSEGTGCTGAITDAAGAVAPDTGAVAVEIVRVGVLGDDTADIGSKDEEEDVTAVGIDAGRVLAPASHSLASSFSARRVTSANFAEIASTAVRLLPRIEASSASGILRSEFVGHLIFYK